MNANAMLVLAHNEVRLRMRRSSTLVAMLAIIALGWAMVGNPAQGTTMMSVQEARVLYTSSALALGSASLMGPLLILVGFFLLRGRMGEDLRSGMGSVIAATPASSAAFLAGRWLGGVIYLAALAGVFMAAIGVFHAVGGEGPYNVLIYLQTYALILVPAVFFTASFALVFDSVPWLIGKLGDTLYFFIWVFQLSLVAQLKAGVTDPLSWVMLLDFSGLVIAAHSLVVHTGIANFSLGASEFDAALVPIVLPAQLWSASLVASRLGAAALAMLPTLPAVLVFHRFSPDRVKVRLGQQRRTPVAFANSHLQRLSWLVQPLFRVAARLPGWPGQVVADIALSLATSPVSIAAVIVASLASLLCKTALLPGLLIGVVAVWGVMVCDISTRDTTAMTQDMTAALNGGSAQRYWRHFGAALGLGLLMMGGIGLQWLVVAPAQAAALLIGLVSLSAVATCLGSVSKTSRLFMLLFLFGWYVALNVRSVAWVDAVGFNGVADGRSMFLYAALALVASGVGWAVSQRGSDFV